MTFFELSMGFAAIRVYHEITGAQTCKQAERLLSNLVARSLDPWSESARSWESLVINNLAKAFLG